MAQRKEMGCCDFGFLAVLPAGYALLMLWLGRWLAHRAGVAVWIIALPLAVVPVLITFGKHWRNSWILLGPVVVGLLAGLPFSVSGNWKGAASAAFCAAGLWPFVLMVIGAALRRKQPEK